MASDGSAPIVKSVSPTSNLYFYYVLIKGDNFLTNHMNGFILFGNASTISLISGGMLVGYIGSVEFLNSSHFVLSAGYGSILRVN